MRIRMILCVCTDLSIELLFYQAVLLVLWNIMSLTTDRQCSLSYSRTYAFILPMCVLCVKFCDICRTIMFTLIVKQRNKLICNSFLRQQIFLSIYHHRILLVLLWVHLICSYTIVSKNAQKQTKLVDKNCWHHHIVFHVNVHIQYAEIVERIDRESLIARMTKTIRMSLNDKVSR